MRLLLAGIAAIALFLIAPHASQAQCSYYYGDLYYNYVEPYDVERGQVVYIEYYMELYTSGWPDATFPIEISTDKGSTWTTLDKDAYVDRYDYYDQYGYQYAYLYDKVTIPASTPVGTHYLRIREVPNSAKECSWTSPVDYDWQWAQINVTRGCYAPIISKQPQSIDGCQGTNYTLSAVASSDPGYITYEWYKNGVLLTKTPTPTLYFSPITTADAGAYNLVVRDVCGTSTSSQTVKVAVSVPGVISVEPVGKTVCEGQSYTMGVAANGTPLTYQWYRNNIPVAGKTTNSYFIPSATGADEGVYFVIVKGGCGDPDTSKKVTIAVPAKPVFTTPLEGGFFCPGTNAVVTPNVTGTILAYQWYRGDLPIIGATERDLTITSIQSKDNDFYWVEVSVPGSELSGCPAITKSGRVYVGAYDSPVIKKQPSTVDACAGSDQRLVVEADGTGLTYQWFRNGSPIPNSNNYSLALDDITSAQSGDYTVQVSGVCGFVSTSEVAEVHVYALPVITQQPQPVSVNVGGTITLSVGSTGEQMVIWMHNEQEISRGVSTSLVINAAQLSDGGYYRAVLQNACGGVATKSARVTVIDPNSLIPQLTITSGALNNGEVPYGYSNQSSFPNVLVNEGSVPVTITGITVSGPNAAAFQGVVTVAPTVLQPGERAAIVATFTPQHVGAANATFTIESNAGNGPHTIDISGVGVVRYSVAEPLAFGVVDKGSTTTKCFQINNTSAMDVVIDQVIVGGQNPSEFTVSTPMPLQVAAGTTKEICLQFLPSSVGAYSAIVGFKSSTGGNVDAGATGTAEIASSVTLDAIAAGITAYPNPAAQSVTITTGNVEATSIIVVSSAGQLVATLPVSNQLVWNLTAQSGAPVPSGAYTVLVGTANGLYRMQIQVVR